MPKVSSKTDTRKQLLEAGMAIMLQKGYNATGIMEVLQAAGVPKGSFYYYFQSKEDFGLQIINYFDELYDEKVSRHLDDTSLTPVARLRQYCEEGKQNLEAVDCKRGCLIGKLGQELSEQSEIFRQRLEDILFKYKQRFAQCIHEGQKRKEISTRFDAHELAEFFLCGWEGAVMRSKTKSNSQPAQVFIKLMFDEVLASNLHPESATSPPRPSP